MSRGGCYGPVETERFLLNILEQICFLIFLLDFEDFAGGILVEGKNLDMSCNEDVLSPQSKNICKFFKQALDLGANNIAAISFYGKIEQNSLSLEATVGRDITLGTGIKIKGKNIW